MKTYRVTWTETMTFHTEVDVDDNATDEEILYAADRERLHGGAWADPVDEEMENAHVQLIGDYSDDDDNEEVD